MADLKQRLEQHAAAYSLLGEKDLPALLREAAASLRAAPEARELFRAQSQPLPVPLLSADGTHAVR
ncbi:hypothetical protein [Stenotrophomonas acidaminiphila]|uniref:hypothetical protein n=1 Tax=Stenotrophomonas acidaminiphila TaxID=128780 RepID=UPI0028AF51D1|nr:hypothetical protein [Stenotrophomonas acidaminiphila]